MSAPKEERTPADIMRERTALRDEVMVKLGEIAKEMEDLAKNGWDEEEDHASGDNLLIDTIAALEILANVKGDVVTRITNAFNDIDKWYA